MTTKNPKAEVPALRPVADVSIESLLAQAVSNNVPVETLERLVALRTTMKAELAKEAFNRAMAAFQAECPTIVKTKEVKTRSGVVAYRYAPIESIVAQVKEALQRNGFSYSTNMELLPEGVKVSVKVTHTEGHFEVSDMTVPLGNKTDIMSASQVTAAAQTFAKRYAFCNAFGILTGDEDTDARPVAKEEYDTSPVADNAPAIVMGASDRTMTIPQLKKEIRQIADDQADVPLLNKKDYVEWVRNTINMDLDDQTSSGLIAVLRTLKVKFDLTDE